MTFSGVFRKLLLAALASGAAGTCQALRYRISTLTAERFTFGPSKSGKGRPHRSEPRRCLPVQITLNLGSDANALLLLPRTDGVAWNPAQQHRPMIDVYKARQDYLADIVSWATAYLRFARDS